MQNENALNLAGTRSADDSNGTGNTNTLPPAREEHNSGLIPVSKEKNGIRHHDGDQNGLQHEEYESEQHQHSYSGVKNGGEIESESLADSLTSINKNTPQKQQQQQQHPTRTNNHNHNHNHNNQIDRRRISSPSAGQNAQEESSLPLEPTTTDEKGSSTSTSYSSTVKSEVEGKEQHQMPLIEESERGYFQGKSERGFFQDFPQEKLQSTSSTTSRLDQLPPSVQKLQLVETIENKVSSSTAVPSYPANGKDNLFRSLLLFDIINEKDLSNLENLRKNLKSKVGDDHAWMLHYLFLDFCTPKIELQTAVSILQQENKGSQGNGWKPAFLPQDCVVQTTRTRVVSLLSQKTCNLLQLPMPFLLSFLRILIRLLTSESDDEYEKGCLLRIFNLPKQKAAEIPGNQQLPNSSSLKEDTANDKVDFASHRRGNSMYTMARFQCSWLSQTKQGNRSDIPEPYCIAASQILQHLEWIIIHCETDKQTCILFASFSRLLGLICTAGVSCNILRRILSLASNISKPKHRPNGQNANSHISARWLLVRALRTAAEGSSRSFLQIEKASIRNFFSFGGGSHGLSRTINGVASWPFRNDFGMALWFRAESFNPKPAVLLSVQDQYQGGIQVSLMPKIRGTLSKKEIEENNPIHAMVLSVLVINSDEYGTGKAESHLLTVPSCVLLPRVWYHIAVRHTRSRLKGVFSLSSRQQVSIILDGKTMLTKPLNFPKIADTESSTSFLPKVSIKRKSVTPYQTGLDITVRLGADFIGQTGSLYLFNDNVSDATFRAIYEATGGRRLSRKRVSAVAKREGWDSRRGDIVKKSRLLDVSIKKDDAEEIVLSQRNLAANNTFETNLEAALDLGEDDQESEYDVPVSLSRSAFRLKIFLVWDPKRAIDGMALDLHIGAHASMTQEDIHSWRVESAQDVISSVGGIQSLVPLIASFLGKDTELESLGTSGDNVLESSHISSTPNNEMRIALVPDLLLLVASFVQDHNENARELLRCGGIDVIENLILTNKKLSTSKTRFGAIPFFKTLTTELASSTLLVDALLKLQSSCCHYIGLETKVFSRLLFNIPLWFGGSSHTRGVSIFPALLPALSSITRSNPEKVRDCVGTKDMVHLIKDCINDCTSVVGQKIPNIDFNLFERNGTSAMLCHLSIKERRHVVDILLGMIFEILRAGTCPEDLSPFLQFLSFCLDAEWEESSKDIEDNNKTKKYKSLKEERFVCSVNSCYVLLFLMQAKPAIPNFFESFAHCCGCVEGGAAWILSSIINSYDDTIRSLGVYCLSAYMGVVMRNPDLPLSLGSSATPLDPDGAVEISQKSSSNTISIIANMGKGLAAMGPGVRSIVLKSSRLTARVIYKLLWHLLKIHRSRIGRKTNASLIHIAILDVYSLQFSQTSTEYLRSHFVIPDDILPPGFKISSVWADSFLNDSTNSGSGKTLHNPLGISTVIRLLQHFPTELKDQWLSRFLKLVTTDLPSLATLSTLPDWQPCLFHLISETLEQLSLAKSNHADATANSEYTQSENNSAAHPVGNIMQDHTAANLIKTDETLSSIEGRLDLCLQLYGALLGHCVREGGEKALHAVEKTVSLQRVCLNGHDVLCLILSCLLANLCDYGTLVFESSSIFQGPRVNQDSMLLKKSARLVTDAILSSGTEGLNMNAAVRNWRSLRHLTAVIVVIVTKSGFGVAGLFDYKNQPACAMDNVSGGLNGIRLPDLRIPGIKARDYSAFLSETGTLEASREVREREIYRRICVSLAAQVLSLLDAFIFPDSLDSSLPASQLHGLALVRSSEPRLGSAQGPLISSAIRLSLLLLCHLEPCSIKLLQCSSRLRCLLHWALELVRETTALEGHSAVFHELTAPLDRLILAVVLQCHRTLGRCSALLSEIESSSYNKYFRNKESQKKHYRRLLRVVLELRHVVLTAFRGRNEALRASLTKDAYNDMRDSFETPALPTLPNRPKSKETVIRSFLLSRWVSEYQDVDIQGNLAIPEQLATNNDTINERPHGLGFVAMDELALESKSILEEFEKSMNNGFEEYLQAQRKWTETGAVRELESEGDKTVNRMLSNYRNGINEIIKSTSLRILGAETRRKAIYEKVVLPWNVCTHWRLAKHTDMLGQRILLIENDNFDQHEDASYDLMLGKEREKEEQGIEARLREKNKLSEVIRRNTDAIVPYDADDTAESADWDEDEMQVHGSDAESTTENAEDEESEEEITLADGFEEWDKIEVEELEDSDAWAKSFIWSDNESVVARFDSVMVVTLQSLIEGKLLLTTHGLYFHQIGKEISAMTTGSTESLDTARSALHELNDRRWRLSRLSEVLGRRYMLRTQALELFFSDSHEIFLNFLGGTTERDRFHSKLRKSCKTPMLYSPKSLNPKMVFKKSKLTNLWRKRKISNFQYLMELNKMAGRTFNDIMQYPVFPWVLSDFTSDTIDLTDKRVYRDLSKPIGALNPERLAHLLERYANFGEFGFPEEEKFLYGTHYSSPGVILHFLIRQEPFTSMAIELQSGRFDCPDRLFFDIGESWNSCTTSSSDMKELIPEFYTLPEMFLNTNEFPLGTTQNGQKVHNVGLPPWANGSAFEFVRIHRLALESEYVSQNLNHWVDLIFGYKQRGPQAELANNVFHYLTYEGAVDLDKITDEIDRDAMESQIQNFGQTPSQLISKEPHPSRYSITLCWKPLITDVSTLKQLRYYTPSKQYAAKKKGYAQGSVINIHIIQDSIVVVYEDMNVGTYKWSPSNRHGNRLKMDKLRILACRESSFSYSTRGSNTSSTKTGPLTGFGLQNALFSVTIGGYAKEMLRRKAIMPSRLISSKKTDSLAAAETTSFLVSCCYWDNTVKIHATDGGKLLGSSSGGHRGAVTCLAIGEDGGLMITGGHDATCRVWVIDHQDMAIALSDGYVQTSLGSSNDGEQLLSCCHVLWGHDSAISCVDLSSDLDLAVSGSVGGTVCMHTIRRGEFIRSFKPTTSSYNCDRAVSKLALHNSGRLVVHMEDRSLHTYTINGVCLCSVNAGERLWDIKICSQGDFLVTGGELGRLSIRTIHNLCIHSMVDLSRHGQIRCLSFTPEDLNHTAQFLFVGSDDGMITIIDKDPNAPDDISETTTF